MPRTGQRGKNPSGSLSTLEAATVLGISYPTLLKLLKSRKIPEPPRSAGVRYWNGADIRHAQLVLTDLYESGSLRRGKGKRR